MSEFFRDLRFAIRLLTKSPVFAATGVLLLAIGISANALIFSVVNAVILRPLPVPHPENLVRLVIVHPTNFVTWDHPYDFCDRLASSAASLSEVICQGQADVAFRDGASTERVRVHAVSPNFFSSLNGRAHLGRVLTADDEHSTAPNAVLSYSFWQRRFHGDGSILGRSIILRDHPFTIVGVSAEAFNGLTIDTSPDIRVPAALDRVIAKPNSYEPASRPLFGQIFGRLRAGVSIQRANGELANLQDQIFSARDVGVNSHLRLEPIANGVSTLRDQFSRGLEVLMAGVALLLLMACANVAGLLLARSAGRGREIGIRLALGASPARIVRQLLTEGLLLALLGGAAGILIARACLPLLIRALPPIRDRSAVLQPLAVHIDLDLRVLGFTVGITVLTAILFTLSPALQGVRGGLSNSFRGGRTTTGRLPFRKLIVTAQVAVCTVILIGAALMVETLQRMHSMNAGFDRDRVLTFTVDPGLKGYTPEQGRALSRALLDKARALPGVERASIASFALMRGTGMKATFGVAGSLIGPTDFLNCSIHQIAPGYFETMGMRVLAGRDFNWRDLSSTTPRTVIVNETFARRFFPHGDPIGGRVGFPGPGNIAKAEDEIIGVVNDAKYRSLREPIQLTVYDPMTDGFNFTFTLHVRTNQRPETMVGPVREALRSLDPELPIIEVQTLRDEVEASLWQERLLASLATIFGAIAALLASIGLYGTIDYSVKSRTREIGVRIALGARPSRIVGLLSSETSVFIVAGVALGLGAYAGAAVWIRRVLYDVPSWDPRAIVPVVLLIVLIAAIAASPAAYRAVRIDPASALRTE